MTRAYRLVRPHVGLIMFGVVVAVLLAVAGAAQASPKGPQGPPGSLAGYEVVGVEQRFDAGVHELTATCPAGKVAVGGGYQASADGADGANTEVSVADFSGVTDPEGDGTWQATAYTVAFDNSDATGSPSGQGNMRVRVTCVTVN